MEDLFRRNIGEIALERVQFWVELVRVVWPHFFTKAHNPDRQGISEDTLDIA